MKRIAGEAPEPQDSHPGKRILRNLRRLEKDWPDETVLFSLSGTFGTLARTPGTEREENPHLPNCQ